MQARIVVPGQARGPGTTPAGSHFLGYDRAASASLRAAGQSDEGSAMNNNTDRAIALPRAVACLAVAAALAAGCSKEVPPPQRPPPEVSVLTVEPRDIRYTPNFVAQTESSQQVNIVARVSGFLDKIAYQEGEVVKERQLLFQLDPKPFQAQLEAARGELLSQQARFTTADATLKRVKPLTAQNALSQADLDRAQGEFDAAKAAVFAAQAKVKEAELNLGYATIRSPVTGLASRSLQRQGAFVNAMSESANLTYVAAVDPIWVTFSVSQNLVAKWSDEAARKLLILPNTRDYTVQIVLPDGTRYPHTGRINFSDPSFSQETGSFMVRAVLPNPKRELRPGMFVTAYLEGAQRPNAIAVPQLAVQQGSNGHLVYVIKPDGSAEVRPVVVGDYYGDKDIIVLSGLHAGDRVVVDGMLKVVPGQPVKIAAPGAAASAPGGAPEAGAAKTKK
ncbi:MAG TPA: efflux RND transporter periplasmic adaptor subunit [Rubrivivax sp.]|nr:efflux RND transporter periplasmic adaptor subunit [Rubrivivax sp.]